MARYPSLLAQQLPSAIVPAHIHIGHVQLRDLIICPRERGVVNYIQPHAIVEHDLLHPNLPPRTIADLDFTPNCLTYLPVNDGNDTLIAAGGQEAEIHLSLHSHSPASSSTGASTSLTWQYDRKLQGSINNSVFLTGLSLTRAHESAVEPRVGISNNDFTVKVYDVPMRVVNQKRALREVGSVRLDVPVNHSSISPDGQTLLSVGDSSKLHLHHISGGSSRLTFSHIHCIPLPAPLPPTTANLAASFSTSFSGDGLKFAVGSQEGVVAVYDVRWLKRPIHVVQTDKTRGGGGLYGGGGGMWLNDDPWEWTRGSCKAPGWSARSVKFSKVGEGREVLVFTEHTSYIHILDASTFQTDELVRIPATSQSPLPTTPLPARPSSPTRSQSHNSTHNHHRQLHLPSPASSRGSISASVPASVSSYPSPRRRRQRQQTQQSIVQALSESFRIPTPSSSSSAPSSSSTNTNAGTGTSGTRRFSPPESISDSTWRTLQMAMVRHQADDEESGVVVIPHLGDRALESDVHALLQVHGIVAQRPSPSPSEEELESYRRPEEMDVDVEEEELDGDEDGEGEGEGEGEERECTPSRSTSPSPSSPPVQRMGMGSFAGAGWGLFTGAATSPEPPSHHSHSHSHSHNYSHDRHRERSRDAHAQDNEREREKLTYPDDLDIAGVCFDPEGGFVYAGTTSGVVEFGLRGAGVRWWDAGEWA